MRAVVPARKKFGRTKWVPWLTASNDGCAPASFGRLDCRGKNLKGVGKTFELMTPRSHP
jgi:hypothetical protein